jgi:hypothetical protein
MGIHYFAYNRIEDKFFEPPNDFGDRSYHLCKKDNPFPHMLVFMQMTDRENYLDQNWTLESDIMLPDDYSEDSIDVTEEVYKKWKDYCGDE